MGRLIVRPRVNGKDNHIKAALDDPDYWMTHPAANSVRPIMFPARLLINGRYLFGDYCGSTRSERLQYGLRFDHPELSDYKAKISQFVDTKLVSTVMIEELDKYGVRPSWWRFYFRSEAEALMFKLAFPNMCHLDTEETLKTVTPTATI